MLLILIYDDTFFPQNIVFWYFINFIFLISMPAIVMAGYMMSIFEPTATFSQTPRILGVYDLFIVVLFALVYYYLLTSIVSKIWYRIKNKIKGQKEKETVEF